MATFKLGAFVTDITGSIGGTTFKRGAGNKIILNKTRGISRNRLLTNLQVYKNALIFRKFSLLTPTEKQQWNDIATEFLFPDKYGVPRNITGRQLFNKLSIQLSTVNSSIGSPALTNNELPTLTLDNFNITQSLTSAELQINIDGIEVYVLVQIEVSLKTFTAPQYTRRKVTAFILATGAIGFDIITELLQQYPYISSEYNVRAYVTSMNEWGFKSPPSYIDAVWLE